MKKALVFLFSLALIVSACNEEKDPATLGVSVGAVSGAVVVGDTIKVPQTGGAADLIIESNVAWNLSGATTWCKASPASGNGNATVAVTMDANNGYSARMATFTITAGDAAPFKVIVKQMGVAPVLEVSGNTGIPQEGNEDNPLELTVTTPLRWTVTADAAATWCSLTPATTTFGGQVLVSAPSNNAPAMRSATLTFVGRDAENVQQATKTVVIDQFGETPGFNEIDPVSISSTASTITVDVRTNLDYEVTIDAEGGWLTKISNTKKAAVVDWTLVLGATANTTTAVRVGTVTLAAGTTSTSFTVTQASKVSEAAADSLALVAIYNASMSAASWSTNYQWNLATSYKTWKGVTTNADGRVIKLVMGNLGTSSGGSSAVTINDAMDFSPLSELVSLVVPARSGSTIPASIGRLSKLEYLRIKSCVSSVADVAIPDVIYNLTNLHYLEISSFANVSTTSFVTGAISANIARLTQLDTLILSGNKISALPAEIASLTSLLLLEMKNNWSAITLPDAITNLTALKKLDMKNAGLNGKIPANIGNLGKLENLDLSSNKFDYATGATIPASITQLTNLKTLDLSSSQLTGTIPTNIGDMVALTSLNLSNNKTATSSGLTGAIPSSIGNLTNLTFLNVKNNSLSGTLPGEMGNLAKLTSLDVTDNQFTGVAVGVGQLKVTNLSFANNKLSTLAETNFPNVTMLTLSNNEFTADGFPATITAPKLTSVVLTNNKLTHLPAGVLSISTLTNLTLTGNPFTASAMANDDLSQLTSLTALNFGNCTTITAIPECMKTAAPSLAALNMDGCRISSIQIQPICFTTIKDPEFAK